MATKEFEKRDGESVSFYETVHMGCHHMHKTEKVHKLIEKCVAPTTSTGSYTHTSLHVGHQWALEFFE